MVIAMIPGLRPAMGYQPPQEEVAPSEDEADIRLRVVEWSSFPRMGTPKQKLKWCRKTLSADRLLWIFPWFWHNAPGKCVVHGTDCGHPLVYQLYTDEMKEVLKHHPILSDMDKGRPLMGTYCPACVDVLMMAMTVKASVSEQRVQESMFGKLADRFMKKKHSVWQSLRVPVPAFMRAPDEKPAWEDIYTPFITQARADKLPILMIDENTTIITLHKPTLDKKYGVKEEVKETGEE